MNPMNTLRKYLPILTWGAEYNRQTMVNDLVVAGIVTIMLIPQSLAYAMLAGLPAQVGLYASMAPLLLYAIFGTSRALAVGPVAVASLMTAAAVGKLASQGTPEYYGAAIALALVSGLLLVGMGLEGRHAERADPCRVRDSRRLSSQRNRNRTCILRMENSTSPEPPPVPTRSLRPTLAPR